MQFPGQGKPPVGIIFDSDMGNRIDDAEGKHRHLIVDPAQQERIIKTYTEVASAKPVPRQRFRPPQQQQQPAPPKPAETKPPPP